LQHKGYGPMTSSLGNSVAQRWKYNGKEYDESLDINTYDFGARNYDPALGRWMNIDPLSEEFMEWSPYNAMMDNPLKFVDPDGMAPFDWFKNQEGKVVWFDNTSESFTSENGDQWENIGANLAEAEESLNVPKDQNFEWNDLEAVVLGGSKGNGNGALAPVVLESTAQVSFDLNVENAGESGLERIDGQTEITGVNVNVTMSTGVSQPIDITGVDGSFGLKEWTALGKRNVSDSGSFQSVSTLSNLQSHSSGAASLTIGLNTFNRISRNQFGGSSLFNLGIRSTATFRLPQNGRKGFFSTSNTVTIKK
ncbi:RHS repeat domain-containing protein, partial [Joostella sp. CR20]|uniref:RHS repeat domain-containing protein n=1 Tax=Joostella sp. CR20 TaxID=2804312 RepID=UPI00313C7614